MSATPFHSLADGWENQAADLNQRAQQLAAQAAQLRDPDTAPTVARRLGSTNPAELELAAASNAAAASQLDQCADALRRHLALTTPGAASSS